MNDSTGSRQLEQQAMNAKGFIICNLFHFRFKRSNSKFAVGADCF